RHSENLLDVARLRRVWARLRNLPRSTAADVMTHGDLIPGNVLVSGGRLAGVLDVGDLGPADPALDLVGAWHLLEVGPRQVLRDDLERSDLEWERGKAWAVEQSVGAVWGYIESNPAISLTGQRTPDRLMAAARAPRVRRRSAQPVLRNPLTGAATSYVRPPGRRTPNPPAARRKQADPPLAATPAIAGSATRGSVGRDDRAGAGHLAASQSQRPERAVVAERAFAAARHQRGDHQPELVHQAQGTQGPGEPGAR